MSEKILIIFLAILILGAVSVGAYMVFLAGLGFLAKGSWLSIIAGGLILSAIPCGIILFFRL